MRVKHIGLVSQSSKVSARDLSTVSAALQKQAVRDLGPIWDISATVDVFETLDDLPVGYWPVVIRDSIGPFGGFHLSGDGQPFALVKAHSNIDRWSHAASHEVIEMLVDPFGDRLIPTDSPKPGQGRVKVLIEVSDPCQHARYGYSVNGVLVTDFYTPEYLDPVKAAGVRYSFTGSIKSPKQILPGGYVSWLEPDTDYWWQKTRFGNSETAKTKYLNLGKLTRSGGSFRSQIDSLTAKSSEAVIEQGRGGARAAGYDTRRLRQNAAARAQRIQAFIDAAVSGNDVANV